jgi:hypothetical protein
MTAVVITQPNPAYCEVCEGEEEVTAVIEDDEILGGGRYCGHQ